MLLGIGIAKKYKKESQENAGMRILRCSGPSKKHKRRIKMRNDFKEYIKVANFMFLLTIFVTFTYRAKYEYMHTWRNFLFSVITAAIFYFTALVVYASFRGLMFLVSFIKREKAFAQIDRRNWR